MATDAEKRGRGRPPKHGEAMPGATRQILYAKARQRDIGEVGYALKTALRSEGERAAFIDIYRGSQSGQRLQRGLARVLADDPDTLAFFDDLFLLGDENKTAATEEPVASAGKEDAR